MSEEFMSKDEAKEAMDGLRAAMDQAKEGAKEISELMFAYYSGMKEAGFKDEEAMILTVAYQNSMFQAGSDS